MAISILDVLKEQARQTTTGDSNFYTSKYYVFKIKTLPNKGPCDFTGEAYFPLPINPDKLGYRLPFATEITPLQESGVNVDQGGIVTGSIMLSATTGFKLRKNKNISASSGETDFTGLLPQEFNSGQMISGQMALWQLMGRCFNAYSGLIKDPETAHKTHMEFHSLKDQLHLMVTPINVEIERNVRESRLTYRYNIELAVTGEAKPPGVYDLAFLSDDRNIIDSLKDAIGTVKRGIQLVKGTIDDLTACMDEIKRDITNITSIVDDLNSVVTAATDFVEGTKSFFDIPSNFLGSLKTTMESASDTAAAVASYPNAVSRSFKNAVDNLDMIHAAAKNFFKDDYDAKADSYTTRVQKNLNLSASEKGTISTLAAKALSSGGTMSVNEAFGSKYTPGYDTTSKLEDPAVSVQSGQYAGYKEVTITSGDTIQSIALKHTGDVYKWKDIALINNLKPPFVSNEVRLPNTLRVGDPIVVPRTEPTTSANVLSTGNPQAGRSQIEELMGTDFRLNLLNNGQYGFAIDSGHGSTDLLTITGVNNLIQGLETRLRTERGTNLSFPDVGLPRLIGNKAFGQTFTEARFALQQQIKADPRIQRVLGIRLTLNQDLLTMDVDAQPVGFDTNRTIPVTLS